MHAQWSPQAYHTRKYWTFLHLWPADLTLCRDPNKHIHQGEGLARHNSVNHKSSSWQRVDPSRELRLLDNVKYRIHLWIEAVPHGFHGMNHRWRSNRKMSYLILHYFPNHPNGVPVRTWCRPIDSTPPVYCAGVVTILYYIGWIIHDG